MTLCVLYAESRDREMERMSSVARVPLLLKLMLVMTFSMMLSLQVSVYG